MDNPAVLLVWLGSRLESRDDLEEFCDVFSADISFCRHTLIITAEPPRNFRKYKTLLGVIEKVMLHTKKAAVFYIVRADEAESKEFSALRSVMSRRHSHYYYYTLVLGGDFKDIPTITEESIFTPPEVRAHVLGSLWLSFNPHAFLAGIDRLVEMINRVMGYDLPNGQFPDYSEEELRLIAWHISRENFNLGEPRRDARPKYPIVNGRPDFSWVKATAKEVCHV